MNFKNYYSILGILPQATQKEIEISYKTMAKKWHPDINKGVNATVQMQLISEAYGVLKNAEKRRTYNVEYYRYFKSGIQNPQKTEVKIERCHYCSKNIANDKFSYTETFYKETSRTKKEVLYKTVNVEIPRCEECFKNHGRVAIILFGFLPFIAFTILGLILGLTIWSMWFLCLIGGGFIGLVLGIILSEIDNSIVAKEAGIKKESDYDDYAPITTLYKENWTIHKPTA